MPGHDIAKVGDQQTREALLGMQSEFFERFDGLTHDLRMLASAQASHTDLCEEIKRQDQQRRESMDRVLAEMAKGIKDLAVQVSAHVQDDLKYQSGHLKWIIGGLVTLLSMASAAAGTFASIAFHTHP